MNNHEVTLVLLSFVAAGLDWWSGREFQNASMKLSFVLPV